MHAIDLPAVDHIGLPKWTVFLVPRRGRKNLSLIDKTKLTSRPRAGGTKRIMPEPALCVIRRARGRGGRNAESLTANRSQSSRPRTRGAAAVRFALVIGPGAPSVSAAAPARPSRGALAASPAGG